MESRTKSENFNTEEDPLNVSPNSHSDINPSINRPDTLISQISWSNTQTERTFCQKWIAWIIATLAILFTILVRTNFFKKGISF